MEPSQAERGNVQNDTLPVTRGPGRTYGGDTVGILGQVIGAVGRHLRLVAAVSLGIALLTIVIVLSLGERYTATALLVVDQRDLRLLGLETPAPAGASPNVDSEVEIMKSTGVARDVAARLNLANDPRFGPSADSGNVLSQAVGSTVEAFKSVASVFGSSDDEELDAGSDQGQAGRLRAKADPNAIAAQALQKITTVRRRGLTNVIAIDVTAETPREAARLANAYADTYIDGQINARLNSAERAEAALSRRVTELGEALRRSETQIKAFAFTQASQSGDDTSRREIDRLQSSIAAAARDANALTARLRELNDLVASHSYASLGQTLAVPEMVLLDEQRRTLEQRLQRPSEGDQRTAELRQRLELVNSQLQTLTSQRVEPVRRQMETSNERLASLRRELEQVVQKSDQSTDISVQLFRLQQEAASTRQLYQDYLSRLKALAQQRNIVSSDVHVVAPATVPPVKSFPPRTLLVLFGGVAGVAIAVGAAYARDNYPRNIKVPGELEEATGAPNVGLIPVVKKGSGHGGIVSPEDQVFDDPMSDFSEAIRRLRISLDLVVNRGAGFKSLLVTSAHAAEGKSTIAVSLARAAAETGLKVVLLDCNLRDPSLHTRLGLGNHDGLVQLLLSPNVASEPYVIASDPRSTCSVITSGELGDIAPDRALQSVRFARLMRELETKFDLIVMDSTSVASAADPLIVAQHADAVLFIARAGRASPHAVQAAAEDLSRARGRNVVTALNFAMPPAEFSFGAFNRSPK